METEQFKQLAESGELTMGQALDHAMTMPKAGSRIQDLKKAIAAGKLGDTTLDTPLKEALNSESFLSNVDTPRANYYVGVQGFEGALKKAFIRAKIPYLSTLGLETDLTDILKGGGYSEGQLRRTRSMEALIPSGDLDEAYADAFTNMNADKNISDDTKRFLFFHKNTIVRVDTVLGAKATKTTPAKPPATLADIVISKDPNTKELTVTLKGEKRVNKTRLDVTYKGTMAAFLKEQFDISKAANPGKKLKDIKLFDTTKSKTDAAHNKHIKPIVEERFPTQIPVDPKSGESGWRPTDIRSAVQDQLEKEFEINFALAEDFAGHKVKDAYKSAQANPAKIGEIAENLVRQTAKNLNTPTTNSVIAAKFGIPTTVFNAEGTASFPALVEDYRGAGQALQPAVPLTEAQKAEMDASAFLSAEKQTAKALDLQQQNIEKAAALDVDKAREGIERQDQLAALRQEQKDIKQAAKVAEADANFDTYLDDMAEEYGVEKADKGIISRATDVGGKVIKGLLPVAIGASTIAATREAEAQGASPFSAAMQGLAAGASEVVAPPGMAYSDAPFREEQRATMPAGSGLGPRTDVAPQMDAMGYIKPEFASYPMEAAPQPNIPDPAPSAPDMAAQGFVPVPEARANAMRGEATAMDQAPSFLYGGVVR
jgi:hypothetical protein